MYISKPIAFFVQVLVAIGMVAIAWQAFSFTTDSFGPDIEAVEAPAAETQLRQRSSTPSSTFAGIQLASMVDEAVALHNASADSAAGFIVTNPLHLPRPLEHGEYVWNDDGVPDGPIRIVVDLSAEALYAYRGGYEIGRAVALYGYGDHPTPLGRFTITQKNRDHVSNIYDVPMPYMMRLTNDGIAIHGSNVDAGAASHGCIGVPIDFAELLFEQVDLGTVVLIQEQSPYANGYRIDGI